ncbi:MAG: MMPL family transporter, partial [bacterium]|nr:MMPL family transporter [bacterium]
MEKWIQKLLEGYLNFIHKKERFCFVILVIVTVIAAGPATTLKLNSSLKELLPKDSPSVQAIDNVIEKVGGVGTLILAIESPDPAANRRFADDMAVRLRRFPPGMIRYFDYRTDEVEQFYRDHSLVYLSVEDLKEVQRRLSLKVSDQQEFQRLMKRSLDYKKFKQWPLYVDLGEEEPVILELDDLREKYSNKHQGPVQSVDNYFGDEEGQLLVMVIRPYGENLSIDFAQKLVGMVKKEAADLHPERYSLQMKIGYTGTFMGTIEEYEILKKDIFSTTLLCLSLVAFCIIIFFGRLRPLFLLGASLFFALTWTFAITKLVIGHLNAQTAFLGSIVVGTGINYGIILIGRYFEERREKKHAPRKAIQIALEETIVPTFLAAATTAASFAVMLAAGIRSLSQFGFIGFVGILLCWLSSILIIPLFILLIERVRDSSSASFIPSYNPHLFDRTAQLISRSPGKIILCSILLVLIAGVVIGRSANNAIEYDFSKLRNKKSIESGADAIDRKVGRLFDDSTIPTIIYVHDPEEGKEVCDEINRRVAAQPDEEQRVDSCYTISNFLPNNQEMKRPILARLKNMARAALTDQFLYEEGGEEFIDKMIPQKPLVFTDLPPALSRHFEDIKGKKGTVVFVKPRRGMWFSDGRNLIAFAETIRNISLPGGRLIHPAGDAILFAD